MYGEGMVRSLGKLPSSLFVVVFVYSLPIAKEVDRIEEQIKNQVPAAKYIDLETD